MDEHALLASGDGGQVVTLSVLLWSLLWVMPSNADTAFILRRVQSECWITRHAAMQADSIQWNAWWPVVKHEADSLRQVMRFTVPALAKGAYWNQTMPDTLHGAYFVVTSNRYGRSWLSNMVGH